MPRAKENDPPLVRASSVEATGMATRFAQIVSQLAVARALERKERFIGIGPTSWTLTSTATWSMWMWWACKTMTIRSHWVFRRWSLIRELLSQYVEWRAWQNCWTPWKLQNTMWPWMIVPTSSLATDTANGRPHEWIWRLRHWIPWASTSSLARQRWHLHCLVDVNSGRETLWWPTVWAVSGSQGCKWSLVDKSFDQASRSACGNWCFSGTYQFEWEAGFPPSSSWIWKRWWIRWTFRTWRWQTPWWRWTWWPWRKESET